MLNKQMLVLFFGLVTIYTFLSEALFALYQPYFQSLHIKIGQFGIFYAIISLFSAIGALSITGLAKRHNAFKLLLLMMLAVLFTLTAMLFNASAFTYIAIIPSAIGFGYGITLQNTIIQKLVSSKHQATAVSVGAFIRTISFMVSVIIVGISLDHFRVSTVNAILSVLTASLLIPFILSLRRKVII
jgi:predicted MFS family arabinose efflux permease